MKGKMLFCSRIVAAVLIVILVVQSFYYNFGLTTDAASQEQLPAFTFTVRDGSLPVGDANISVRVSVVDSVYNIEEDNFELEGFTDKDGLCSFVEITELMDDDRELLCEYEVKKYGYYDYYESELKISNNGEIGFTENVDVELTPIPTIRIDGSIYDENGDISGAEVSLVGYSEHSAVTDKNGRFRINNVYNIGTYSIIVKHPDYRTHKEDIDLSDFDFSIKLRPKSEQEDFEFQISSPDPITYGDKFKNAAINGKGTGKLTYSVDNEDIATVNSDGSLNIKRAGEIVVTATKDGDEEYRAKTISYRLTINKADQTDFSFVKEQVSVKFGVFEQNDLRPHQQSKGKVTYSIKEDLKGLLDSIDPDTGEYKFNEFFLVENSDDINSDDLLGKVTIIATKDGDDKYNPATAEYTLNVFPSNISEPNTIYSIQGELGTNGWYKSDVTIVADNSYKIKSIWRTQEGLDDYEESEWEFAETVTFREESSGPYGILIKASDESIGKEILNELKIDKTAPELKISYEGSWFGYLLNIITFGFYKEKATINIEVTDEISGITSLSYRLYEESKKGDIENRIIEKEEYTYEESKKSVKYKLKIDANFRGKLSIIAIDEAGNVLEYNSSDDRSPDKPNIIVVDNKAPEVAVQYDNNAVKNGKYYNRNRTATIKIHEDNFFAEDVEFTVLKRLKDAEDYIPVEVNPTFKEQTVAGTVYHITEIIFDEDADYIFDVKHTDKSKNTFDSYEADEFTIDKTKPIIDVSYDNDEMENDGYYKNERTATITITEHNFDSKGISAKITAKDAEGKIIEIEDYMANLKDPANWDSEDDIHKAMITFKEDGYYSLDINYTDLAGNVAKEKFVDSFVIDKTAPINLSVKYSEPVLDVILEIISFGFYNKSMNVEISADDVTSGIDYFVYSYNVEEDASSINTGKADVVIPAEDIKYENGIRTAKASFMIDPQFRGKVSFKAVDKSGNMTKFEANEVIVVDNVAPNVKVYYDNHEVSNESFYNAYRTATIEIEEANFYEDDVVITVGRRKYEDTDYTETRVRPTFSKDNDIYTAQIEFNEDGDYTFDISYTDKSGNVFDSYETDMFSIDTTKPVINVSFDNNPALNGNYYNAQRIATITVEEHYFNAENIVVTYTAVDIENNKVATQDFASYLKDPANWTTKGDIHTATIVFSEDARYTFNLEYTDFAGNKSEELETLEFIVDKTKPENLTINYSTSVLDTIIDNLQFGFYNSPAEVTITADDVSSGIDYIIYSYKVEEGSSPKNKGLIDQKVTSENINYSSNGKTATIRFSIPPQYRGKVDFKVVDKAGNMSIFEDEKIIVVDNVAPGVTVRYDNNSPQNSKYYNTNRTATITIDEANFFSGDVKIIVGKRLDYESSFKETSVNPKFTKNGDIYTAEVVFDENADYTFDISYTDKSGNIFDSYTKDEFTIDKRNPQIQVIYDNNSSVNYNKFKEKRIATIKITEQNFRAVDVEARIIGRDKNGNSVVNLPDRLKNESSWTRNGDVYTATILFEEDANYEFDISCTDLAGNKNSPVDYSSSVAPNEFTVDKTPPTGTIEIGDWNASTDGTVWDIFLDVITMGLWSNKELMVTITAGDGLSGVDYIKYFRTDKPVSLKELVEKSEGWTVAQGNKASFKVTPDEQFIVYATIIDMAGNATYISSDGVIVDKTKPDIGNLSPKISFEIKEDSRNNIFNKDVNVDIMVEDPIVNGSVYSGLKSVEYQIVNMGSVTKEGVLYTFDKVNPSKSDLLQQWKGSIVVDSKNNNSNDVKVIITAKDNAGNVATKTLPLMIDVTPPKIKVSFDNNAEDGTFNGFFKEERTATVVVSERNFRKEDVVVKISNTHGTYPKIGEWVYVAGKGNGDDDTYTTKITFAEDGDYTFDISYVDLANNSNASVDFGNSVAPNSFTIDKTLPVIEVRYNNERSNNGNYFNADRVATIYITEHNFDTSRLKINMTSTDDGKPNTVPVVSHWSSNGDVHTATVNFSKDSLYTFDIEFTDMAGNKAADYEQDIFYIDTEAPTISITGVADKSANNGDVIPIVECYDTNIDFQNVTISLTGATRQSVKLDGVTQRTNNGMVFRFNNFEKIKEVDDLYTLSVNAIDKAGNASYESITFSVNRFGSVYSVTESTKRILNKFISNEEDITFIETNVDVLQDVRVTLFKDNITKVLIKDKDYTVEEISGDNMWYQYIYKIKKENFVEDGVYRITVYSVDKANNKSGNNMESKLTEISFGVDKTPPNIIVADLESDKTYPLNNKPVSMSINDNLSLESVVVLLNGKELKSWTRQDIENEGLQSSGFKFEISGDSTRAHMLNIVATDSAGNKQTVDIKNFYVTTNLMIRFRNNKIVFYGTTGGTTTLVMLAAYTIFKRRRLKVAN